MTPEITMTAGGKYKCPHCVAEMDSRWAVVVHCNKKHRELAQPKGSPKDVAKDVAKDKAAGTKAAAGTAPPAPAKPKRVRPAPAPKPRPAPQPAIAAPTINFCPCCGTNLALISRALAVAASVQESITNG